MVWAGLSGPTWLNGLYAPWKSELRLGLGLGLDDLSFGQEGDVVVDFW